MWASHPVAQPPPPTMTRQGAVTGDAWTQEETCVEVLSVCLEARLPTWSPEWMAVTQNTNVHVTNVHVCTARRMRM